ncbi:zinc ribbon domain-containing protein [Paraburkholderia agricolaris]|uniref:zinc ribbon domain-containing protein n=1 Tax=Paraburkholderia agricolaris TaxID=2152888 RepID=UPI0038BD1E4C
MAALKRKQHGKEVSDKATSCVQCGAPVVKRQTGAGKMFGGLGMLIVGSLITWGCVSDNGARYGSDAVNQAQSCRKDDLQCLGDQGNAAASIYCKGPIERLATRTVRWTGGPYEVKFSRFRWSDSPGGAITYIGDKAEFQNDIGVYTPIIYECGLASDGKTVLAVSASAGRLPP